MKPAPFKLLVPRSLDEALDVLLEHRADAKLLAGGQSLVPVMNFRMATPSVVIDLNRVEELGQVRLDGPTLRIGAMVRQKRLLTDELIARCSPLLACAARHIGHVQTRNRGTIGGSLAHADPAAELPLVAVTLDVRLHLRSTRGTRDVAATDFFTGPLSTVLESDEILTEIALRAAPEGTRASFREFARRHGDFAVVAAAVQRVPGEPLSVALGGIGDTPQRCLRFAHAGASARDLPRLLEEEVSALQPYSDLHASAEYRRQLAASLLADCLSDVVDP